MCSEYENYDTKAGLGALEGFVSRFVTFLAAENPRVTCDSRDREYGTFLTRFFHARFFQYKSYEFQELRYECVPNTKNTRQKRSSSNFGFTPLFACLFDTFSDFGYFSRNLAPVTRR